MAVVCHCQVFSLWLKAGWEGGQKGGEARRPALTTAYASRWHGAMAFNQQGPRKLGAALQVIELEGLFLWMHLLYGSAVKGGGGVMRTGVIVYVVGETPVGENPDIGAEIERLHPGADRVEVVSRDAGHFDVADAWWSLTAKGMQRIFCMIGEMNSAGGLKLQERRLRLCG